MQIWSDLNTALIGAWAAPLFAEEQNNMTRREKKKKLTIKSFILGFAELPKLPQAVWQGPLYKRVDDP